jgi:type IV secretory pathway VirB2 component (pilin)
LLAGSTSDSESKGNNRLDASINQRLFSLSGPLVKIVVVVVVVAVAARAATTLFSVLYHLRAVPETVKTHKKQRTYSHLERGTRPL